VTRQYYVLRVISLLFKIIAIIMLLVGLSGLVFALLRVPRGLQGQGDVATWAQVVAAGALFGWGLAEFMVLYAVGEVLNILIAIEENTRVTSMRLVRMISLLGEKE